ncbi:hypothetical protein DEO72_LG3g1611 [Vigna unguiculata]|uniref:Uncharacterized protein n=1 Tax=Vigna unguiculata TaxID=3917 RepID=A0A4D6LF00_VIGUN|nr:hypothetical protein DEO72_LG3g1611 [Vigna unguiculata]
MAMNTREKWLAMKPYSTLSSELLEMLELVKNALLVPNLCGEGSHDLRRHGNLHLQRRVMRSLARKSIARTVWRCWKGGVLKGYWVIIRVRSCDEVLWNDNVVISCSKECGSCEGGG